MAVHDEASFESAIEADLLSAGWQKGAASHYNAALGLDTAELMAFFGATQAKEIDKLKGFYGGIEKAQRKVAERIAAEIDARGTLDVLRRGVKDHGTLLRLAYFAPAHAITPELQQLYAANRLTVTRQLRYSATTTDELDLALFVNGVPVATAELKNQLTGQTVEHAKSQYRPDRDPRELLFANADFRAG